MNTQLTKKPSNVNTAGVLLLIGGILTILTTLGVAAFMIPLTLCFWTPLTIYGIVAGILSIVKGAQLMGDVRPGDGAPVAAPVLLMINIMVNFDIISGVLGIIAMVMTQDRETKDWLSGVSAPAVLPPGSMPGAVNVPQNYGAPAYLPPPQPGAPSPAPVSSPAAMAPTDPAFVSPEAGGWGQPAAPAAPVAPDDAGWGTATEASKAEADRAAAGSDWSDWGASGTAPAPPSEVPSAAPAVVPAATVPPMDVPPMEVPSAPTPVEPALALPREGEAKTAPAGDWGGGEVSVSQETPPEADPLNPAAWDMADELNRKPE